MDLDELRTVQSKERRKDSLQHLRDSFYEDVADYVRGRKAERDRRAEAVKNPFSDPEVRRLSDEIETAEEVAEAVYERRVGKVVKLASFAAAEMPVDENGLTDHERDLFDDLVDRIGENKSRVLDVLSGERVDGTAASADDGARADVDADADVGADALAGVDDGVDADAGGVLADAMGGERDGVDADPEATHPERTGGDGAPAPSAADGPSERSDAVPDDGTSAQADADDGTSARTDDDAADARTTVRITRDVGVIFGVDEREYDLADEDVVRLPAANAEPLIERGAAERLD